jgi:glyoxylase-like metal-dependent hydrolase (beta-lactamase superfamily II)
MNTIDVATLRCWLEEDRPVTVLDVRSHADRTEWAIPHSQHADVYAALKAGAPTALRHLDLPYDTPIVTVCGAGKMSVVAAEQLAARGYTVYSLHGGMQAWSLAWNHADISRPDAPLEVIQVRRTGKGCLSYIVGTDREAVVIDAALDPAVYESLAQQRGWHITAVLDTHIHADHLSRSRLLAQQVGATLYLPTQERVQFPFTPLHDGAMVSVGTAHIRALHTPGHTLESMSYVLNDHLVCTGDTLFLVAVGRPDLDADPMEAEQRAHLLYTSLQRLLTLPGDTLILPGHASSPIAFDGRPLIGRLAEVRAAIPRLGMPEDAFVADVLARIPPTPPNHRQIVTLNEAGATLAVDPITLEAGANRCAIA